MQLAAAAGSGSKFFDAKLFIEVTVTLLVIMDPPGTIPVFLGLVGRKARLARIRAARQAVLVSLAVITLFAVAGEAILAYLGIGIPALQGEDVNVALVPLGTPLLAGPGAIAATIVYVRQAHGALGSYIALACAILLVHFVLYTCLRYSGVVIKLVRESGIVLMAKIAGLLLAAIAVQLVANSIRGFVGGG